MFIDQSKAVVSLINKTKSTFLRQKLATCSTKDMFRQVNGLLSTSKGGKLPDVADKLVLANKFAKFLDEKIENIRKFFGDASLCQPSVETEKQYLPSFQAVTFLQLEKIIRVCPNKSCGLDPLPTWLLREPEVFLALLPLLVRCVNESIMSGHMPDCLLLLLF
jgi:hypothetical protein